MKYSNSLVVIAALAVAGCVGPGGSQQGRGNSLGVAKSSAALGTPVSGTRVAYDETNDPVICQKEADSTSRLRTHKFCMHKSEWEALADKNKNDMNDMMRTNINPCSGDSCPGGIR